MAFSIKESLRAHSWLAIRCGSLFAEVEVVGQSETIGSLAGDFLFNSEFII